MFFRVSYKVAGGDILLRGLTDARSLGAAGDNDLRPSSRGCPCSHVYDLQTFWLLGNSGISQSNFASAYIFLFFQ